MLKIQKYTKRFYMIEKYDNYGIVLVKKKHKT